MFRDTIKDFLSRFRESLPGRWFWLVVGLGLIITGVYLMHQRGEYSGTNQALVLWNERFHLEIPNLLQFVVALPYLLAGGFLSAFAFTPTEEKQDVFQTQTENKEKLSRAYYLLLTGFSSLVFALLIFMVAQHKYTALLPWLLLCSLGSQAYLFFRHERSVGVNHSPNITRTDTYWLSGLFLGGLAIASFALNDIPNIILPDEGPYWETARAIVMGNLKPDFFFFGVDTFPLASSIFQGWVMRLAGVTLWGWRFASVFAGTLTVIPLYLLAREWFDRRVAVMAVLIMLTSPYYLSIARAGYIYSQALFPVVLSLYFWSLGYKRASSLYYWLAGIAAGIGFYTYTAAWLGLVAITIMFTLFIIIRRIKLRQAVFATTIFLAASAATAFPHLVFGVTSNNPELLFHKVIETSFISQTYGNTYFSPADLQPEGDQFPLNSDQIFYAPKIYATLLARGTVRTLAALVDPFIVQEPFVTTDFSGGFLAAIGLILGLSFSLRTVKQTRSILLLSWLGAGLLFLGIIAAFPPRHTLLVTIIPVLALLTAVGFVSSIDTLRDELSKKWTPVLIARGQIGVILLVTIFLAFFGMKEYFFVMPTRYPPLFDDIVSWIAWRNEEPLTIVLVGQEEKPHRIQHLVETHLVPHTYITKTPSDFNWKDIPFTSIVFFEHQDESIPPQPLEFSTTATYVDQNNNVIGTAWTYAEVDLKPVFPFFDTFGNKPGSQILIYSMLALSSLVLITWKNRMAATEGSSARSVPWWKKAFFLSILLISAIPIFLVVEDRWFERPISITAVDELWWKLSPLRELGYPRYFLIIFCATILTVLSVLLWRKGPVLALSNSSLGRETSFINQVSKGQYRVGRYLTISALLFTYISIGSIILKGRIPGWDLLVILAIFICGQNLMAYPIEGARQFVKENGQFLVDATIFIIALCSLLYNIFGESKPNIIFFLLFVFASINFLRQKTKTPVIFWISVASLIALTWKINGWEYVVIGDEYNFYNEVRNILENRTAWELINTTFNGNFVYGTHPYFSSYIHYFFMLLFGNHNFGWRFSNPFLVAASLFFYYYFFKNFIPHRTALITVIFLGVSHYLLSFSKIGYNNLQAFFALGLVLATLTWALKTLNYSAFAMLGLATGICFYLYPAALYITPLPFLGMLIFYPPVNKEALKRWGWMIISFALLFYPLIFQPNYWGAKIAGTFFYTDVSNSGGALLKNISLNMLYTSLSFLYIPEQTHFVSTGYMDPISSFFIVIGFVYLAILAFRRNKSALFLALSFLWLFFIVGATHGRNFPTATRMFLLLPWFALFTAYGLEWCADKSARLFATHRKRIFSLATILIVVTNLYNAYVIDIKNMAQYHSLAPLFVKIVREINSNAQVPPKSYAFVAPPDWDTSGMAMIQRAYLVPDSPRQLIDLPVKDNQLPESDAELVKERDVIVIVNTNMDTNIISQVDIQLQNWGKTMCEIRNERDTLLFQLWHSGDLAWLCP